MNSNSTLVRDSDKKAFRVTFLSHWSDIESSDGEKDSVKWYGGYADRDLYVSNNKGFAYSVYKD